MEVTSITKFVRLSPKKARDVAREIQGLPVSNALDILTFTPKKAAFLIGKTLKTAIADAENNFSLDASSLMIKEAVIGAGPTMRRFKPRAKGSAGAIIKRTSHISITLVGAPPEKKKRAPKKAAAKKADKPVSTEEAPASEEATA
ncbi:MAG: 50S ribosomal protein L22 [Akkermansiaceae bacterium]|jgi:large subunit ribosomal protein L22|nr:50S ribosomal protein L22 [Akkermansiaceae bacterium]MDP4646256.1 50S ribosomal protein L22 [Akkermansiaceae bacterium]MDP4720262.1 50S ribosomal protein L22 [Akkermansiaceae bacterium]MDP4779903.1 50S ribosomal protein L22 [Akkermansiaceae bacterium]MDP4845870.1 50S ribosomal protein L22 [Akkermansiaceae bacterium]